MTEPSTSDSPAVPVAIRVFVVDDHPFFREGLVTWIQRQAGLVCCGHADSPDAAYEAITRLVPDVVLIDLHLRGGDGLDLVRRLHAEQHPSRVIVVSQKDETIFAERALEAGAGGYVAKDEACDVLSNAIAAVMRGEIHVSDAVRRMLGGPGKWLRDDSPHERLRLLGPREMQVFERLGRGLSTKEIAFQLNISPKTVEVYRENLKHKLGFPNSAELVRFATLQMGDEKGRFE